MRRVCGMMHLQDCITYLINIRPQLVFCIDSESKSGSICLSIPVRDDGDTFVMVIFALCSRLCNPSDHILRKQSYTLV